MTFITLLGVVGCGYSVVVVVVVEEEKEEY